MMKIQLTIFIAAAIFASCNSRSTKTTNTKPLVVATADATEKYQCPMKCEGDTAYTTAGQCPVCEMDLEKMK
jgi:Cu+-exporting ATPase